MSLIIFNWTKFCNDDVSTVLLFLIMRCICISVRYGIMNPKIYKIYKSYTIPYDLLVYDFYLGAWRSHEIELSRKEILEAIKRNELDMSYCTMQFYTSLHPKSH